MERYRPGEVLLLSFPFADATGAKRRPALVLLDTGDADVVVAILTRFTMRRLSEDYALGKAMEDLNMYVEEIKPGFPDCYVTSTT